MDEELMTIARVDLERYIAKTAARSAQLAAQKTLEMAGLAAPFLTTNKANKQYGRIRVERWVKNGLVKPIREGGGAAVRLPVSELIAAAMNEDGVFFYDKHKPNYDYHREKTTTKQ